MNLQQEFVDKYSNQTFPHAEQLFSALSEMESKITVSPPKHLPCRHYEEIYRFRARRAEKRSKKNSRDLYKDMVYLYETLARTPDEGCCLWIFHFPNGQNFAAFEVV
jgi:hypothetical protein